MPGVLVFAALAVFVMGYPCALGMDTPLAMIRGGGEAAQKGIMMRSGEAFQVFKDVQVVVMGKTGTITKGKPEVTDVIISDPLSVPSDQSDREQITDNRLLNAGHLLWLAASAEQVSEHPLGQAIVDHTLEQGIELAEVTDFQAVPGKGVRATVEGRTVYVGSPAFSSRSWVWI